jgi:hypothetical protein
MLFCKPETAERGFEGAIVVLNHYIPLRSTRERVGEEIRQAPPPSFPVPYIGRRLTASKLDIDAPYRLRTKHRGQDVAMTRAVHVRVVSVKTMAGMQQVRKI